MMLIKSLLLAGFILASAFAESSEITSVSSKPAIATLHVQSNFDFSLTSKEFRVHYSGLGYTTTENVYIKIYKKGSADLQEDDQEIHSFTVEKTDTDKQAIYQFAVNGATPGLYAVAVCAGTTCSEKNPALTKIVAVTDNAKITCQRVNKAGGSAPQFETAFVGPSSQDWISDSEFTEIETFVNSVSQDKSVTYQTDYKKHNLQTNPAYKHNGKVFYAGLNFDIKIYEKLFDNKKRVGKKDQADYADEFCDRKYLLSAHAHIVKTDTKEVIKRFKTTLFLSEGGKQLFIFQNNSGKKVHIEMTHENVDIPSGTYNLWITFCATEKDAIESTFCAEPVIKEQFLVEHK